MAYVQKRNPIPRTGCGRRRMEQMTNPFKMKSSFKSTSETTIKEDIKENAPKYVAKKTATKTAGKTIQNVAKKNLVKGAGKVLLKGAARFVPGLGWGMLAHDIYKGGKWLHKKLKK